MSSAPILQAVKSILIDALAGENPVPVVRIAKPARYDDAATVWIQHRQSPDQVWTNGLVKRQHAVAIGLLVRDDTDSETTELASLAYHDAILNVFYGNHELNGTVASIEIAQQEAPDWVYVEKTWHRARLYILTATEDVALTFA